MNSDPSHKAFLLKLIYYCEYYLYNYNKITFFVQLFLVKALPVFGYISLTKYHIIICLKRKHLENNIPHYKISVVEQRKFASIENRAKQAPN